MIEVNFCEFTRAWDTPKIAVCTDTGCACYSHKSHIRRYAALSLSKKSRALFCWIFRAGMLVFRAKNVRWIMRMFFNSSGQTAKICPL